MNILLVDIGTMTLKLLSFRMSLVPNATNLMEWVLSKIMIFSSICVKSALISKITKLCCSTKLLVVDCVFFSKRAPSMFGKT